MSVVLAIFVVVATKRDCVFCVLRHARIVARLSGRVRVGVGERLTVVVVVSPVEALAFVVGHDGRKEKMGERVR